VGLFNFNLESEIIKLHSELENKTYTPGRYKTFMVYDTKPRQISAAPYRDRVVHHCLCNIIMPLFENTFIYDSYANRIDKGTHKAIKQFQNFMRCNKYVLKCDIKKYFSSIDHRILKDMLHKKIRCNDTRWLMDIIIDNSNPQEFVNDYFDGDDLFTPQERRKGIPIGNLTSQYFANIYLNDFDHWIKEKIRCKYYIRYVDDFVILDNDKTKLNELKFMISEYLQNLRLKIHTNKSQVYQVKSGVNFLGYKVFKMHRLLLNSAVIRFMKRMRYYQKQYYDWNLELEKLLMSFQSWNAFAAFGNTNRLRKELYDNLAYIRSEKL